MKPVCLATLLGLAALPLFAAPHPMVPETNTRLDAQKHLDGYKNTPLVPGTEWHIHDPDRPQPPVAEPRYDGTPVPPPKDAVVIFDGTPTDELLNKTWRIKDGIITVGKGSQKTARAFGSMHLHVEFRIPLGCVRGWGQKQGNSGIFLMDTYEIQVLNGWGNRTYPDGMIGSLYGQKSPLANAARKPGEWQAYDIHFTAPVFEEQTLVSPAVVTVYLNGVLVQDKAEFTGASTWRRTPKYRPHPPRLPLSLQAHGNPVQYRNIWVIER